VVWAVKHFHVYLYGQKCEVYMDHETLLSLLNTPHPSGKLAHWGLALQKLDLSIHYQPGKLNQLADSLSRCALIEVYCINSTSDLSPDQPISAMSTNQPQPQISSAKDREDDPQGIKDLGGGIIECNASFRSKITNGHEVPKETGILP